MFNVPRVLVAGLRGGSGKTLVAVGLTAAWRAEDRAVAAFKKGPDYIDAAWLTHAAGRPCRNLDLFLHPPETIRASFAAGVADADVAVIEGNRGLFDGMDATGSCSAAELARLLCLPVLLVVDATKATRSVAALVLGCQVLDPVLRLRGVVLNQVGGARHERVVRDAIADCCEIPVVGAIPHLPADPFPERHLGLVPPEHALRGAAVQRAAGIVRQYLDLPAIAGIAAAAPPLRGALQLPGEPPPLEPDAPRIGIARDEAFTFYYPENLEALRAAGARLVDVSPLRDERLPPLDALYLGGGFPELSAAALATNERFGASLRTAVAAGLPVYAECGGAVYLGRRLTYLGNTYPMADVLPASFAFDPRPRGHGYAVLESTAANPYFAAGSVLRAHEFHYTYANELAPDASFAFHVQRGHGFGEGWDGLCTGSVLATYTHLHALSSPEWATALVRAARRYAGRAALQAAVS